MDTGLLITFSDVFINGFMALFQICMGLCLLLKVGQNSPDLFRPVLYPHFISHRHYCYLFVIGLRKGNKYK